MAARDLRAPRPCAWCPLKCAASRTGQRPFSADCAPARIEALRSRGLFLKSRQHRLVPRICRHLLRDGQFTKRVEVSPLTRKLVEVERTMLGPKNANRLGMLAHCSANKLWCEVSGGYVMQLQSPQTRRITGHRLKRHTIRLEMRRHTREGAAPCQAMQGHRIGPLTRWNFAQPTVLPVVLRFNQLDQGVVRGEPRVDLRLRITLGPRLAPEQFARLVQCGE